MQTDLYSTQATAGGSLSRRHPTVGGYLPNPMGTLCSVLVPPFTRSSALPPPPPPPPQQQRSPGHNKLHKDSAHQKTQHSNGHHDHDHAHAHGHGHSSTHTPHHGNGHSPTHTPHHGHVNSHPPGHTNNHSHGNANSHPQGPANDHARHHTHDHAHKHSHSHSHSKPVISTTPPAATHIPIHNEPTDFQYSKCTGRKKALCIGINYQGRSNELNGCINDAKNVRDFLIRYHGYKEGDIVMLTDDSRNPRELPTRSNIIDAMHWLVDGAKKHDSLFFHYSGHGGQTPDLDGDEVDGLDEVIYPLDYRTRGFIVDDEMHSIMVKPLPRGCRLTALFDSCHSGTVLDLPYIYSSSGRLQGNHVSRRAIAQKMTGADVISWSGCMDDQTAADIVNRGVAVGAMSYAFMYSLKRNPKQTYQELLKSIRDILRKKYSQKPQLGSSHPIDTNLRFVL